MQNSENKQKSYRGFPIKQRLLPVLLLAFAASFTIFVFGAFDIYSSNIDQFRFSLTDFLLWSLLGAALTAGAICAILLPLRGRVFDIAYAIFFWITLMLFVQGNYLNIGIKALTGDGVGSSEGFALSNRILNLAVWGIVGIACILAVLLIKQKHREIILTVATIAMITVIGMQLIPFGVTSLTSPVWEKKEMKLSSADSEDMGHFLTYKNLDRVSAEGNVIWFVIDRFDVTYYDDYAVELCPEILYNLEDFTYYNDMLSLYPRTYPSIPYMLTGVEHDFFDARTDYLNDAYTNSKFLNLMSDCGYNVNIYTDSYYGYDDASALEGYVTNSSGVKSFQLKNPLLLTRDMTRLSLYRYLPIAAKGWIGDLNTNTFEKHIRYEADYPVYTTDMETTYDFLKENPLQVAEGGKSFSFIHIEGCHLSNDYSDDAVVSVLQQSFQIVNSYLDQLKELGLYEDATIIITGDHGWLGGSDSEYDPFPRPHVTALFVKESGRSGTGLQVNTAPVAQSDIIPTILASEGIQTDIDFGPSVFEIDENETRARKYVFPSWQSPDGVRNDELVIFEVVGSARDLENWRIVSKEYLGGSFYE